MNIMIWLLTGGILGCLTNLLMLRSQGILLNIVVGMVGSLLGAWFLSPLIGAGDISHNNFGVASLVVSFLGAVILLSIVNLFIRKKVV